MPSSPSDPAAYDPAAGEKLIIETPEQTSIEFPLAGIGSRFLAVLIDSLIQIAVVIVLVLIFVGLWLMVSRNRNSTNLRPRPSGSVPFSFSSIFF